MALPVFHRLVNSNHALAKPVAPKPKSSCDNALASVRFDHQQIRDLPHASLTLPTNIDLCNFFELFVPCFDDAKSVFG